MLINALRKDESLNVSLNDCEELNLLKMKESLICLNELNHFITTKKYFFALN